MSIWYILQVQKRSASLPAAATSAAAAAASRSDEGGRRTVGTWYTPNVEMRVYNIQIRRTGVKVSDRVAKPSHSAAEKKRIEITQ